MGSVGLESRSASVRFAPADSKDSHIKCPPHDDEGGTSDSRSAFWLGLGRALRDLHFLRACGLRGRCLAAGRFLAARHFSFSGVARLSLAWGWHADLLQCVSISTH